MDVKPVSMFREQSIARRLVEEDWSGSTVVEIADKLLTDSDTVRTTIYYIKKKTGYIVPYKKREKGKRARELYAKRWLDG